MSTLLKVLKALVNIFCGLKQEPERPPLSSWQSPLPQTHDQHQPYPQQHQQPPQWQQSPSHGNLSKPHSPPHHGGIDQNQINQANPYYIDLRKRANEDGDQMAKCFQESRAAYARGDGAAAKRLSDEAKEHQRRMESLNKEASQYIYIENNKDSKPGEIDLHGLHVKEAIFHTDQALEEAKRRGETTLRLIVGKGLHSTGGVTKIKPAIEELMQKHQLVAELDDNNAGVLVVHLNSGRDRGVGPDEIAHRLDCDDERCTVM
ncbi:hypothetical protein E1B28_000785 [Marasmius oreades]|uniref:Smr domain-containing protein n=1 Tax=Marasmius oreades TaxID=181124 RepID=A0A9P7V258_9AGAR|nr:uncharacterized protein E1B28_000785 [Marasmius oreades]KAG7098885.1 hypothetical protein E1B28_000785 [Marasmius oreades]